MTVPEVMTLTGVTVAATSAIIGANAYVVKLVVQNSVKDAVLKTLKDIKDAVSEHEAGCPALKHYYDEMHNKQ